MLVVLHLVLLVLHLVLHSACCAIHRTRWSSCAGNASAVRGRCVWCAAAPCSEVRRRADGWGTVRLAHAWPLVGGDEWARPGSRLLLLEEGDVVHRLAFGVRALHRGGHRLAVW